MHETTLSPLLASATTSHFLSIESGSLAGQRFPLPSAPGALLLGRERMCNVRFDPERDRVVGRAHARIEVRGDGIYLVDLNSANGTFRSDGSAIRGELRLSAGERFQLGGEGGPWLAVQSAAAQVAVHIAPPIADSPTLITPPPASQLGAATRWQPPPGAPTRFEAIDSPPLEPSRPPRPPLAAPQPAPPRSVAPELERPSRLPPEPLRRPEVAATDPLALRQKQQYQRQLVVISLLLVLACSVGLALGLRDGPVDDETEMPHAAE